MNAPLVSIAIPCFNAERTIGAAIGSALAQSHPAREVIVADDASTDGSRAVAASFGTRVRLLALEKRGGNHARNVALAAARGEWVQFLDADDTLEPAKIERQFAETNGGAVADVIYSPVLWDTPAGRSVHAIDTRADLFTQWLTWQLPQTGGCLWRKSALDALGGWREEQPCCQEHELYLRALQAGLRFVFAPTALAVYSVWSEESLCRRDPRGVTRVKTDLFDKLRAWMKERGTWTESHARIAGEQCFAMARMWAKESIDGATGYHDERRAAGMIALGGDAAPAAYRTIYKQLGFSKAERLARLFRRK